MKKKAGKADLQHILRGSLKTSRKQRERAERAKETKEQRSHHQRSSPHQSKNLHDLLEGSGLQAVSRTVIHNFGKEIRVTKQEAKNPQKPVVERRVKEHELPPKSVAKQPPKPQKKKRKRETKDTNVPNEYICAGDIKYKEFIERPSIKLPEKEIKVVTIESGESKVHNLGDAYEGRRVLMHNLGIDVGTRTVVVAYRDADQSISYLSEINGYWVIERATPFIKNMLNDPNKVRSDGTKRPAKWIELDDKIVVLGKDAEELAYAKNDTLLRPMAEGGISADEEAMTVLASIVQGLIEMAEHEVGKFDDEVNICYCTTASAINKDINIDYHQRVVDMIIDGYETEANLSHNNIKESHAIVLAMDSESGGSGTGIGISWGAGTVTASYINYGMEVYSFCWVGAGDWIDEQVAMRHGYNPDASRTRKKSAKETPTTVARRKMDIDLTPGNEPSDRVGWDICQHYDILINNVIEGIIDGFEENEAEARIEDNIKVYMAGGTASPKGFSKRVAAKLKEHDLPFEIEGVYASDKPLYCVSNGCLIASEMF